ncbi:unnamed protein product [Prunus armeniaca]
MSEGTGGTSGTGCGSVFNIIGNTVNAINSNRAGILDSMKKAFNEGANSTVLVAKLDVCQQVRVLYLYAPLVV